MFWINANYTSKALWKPFVLNVRNNLSNGRGHAPSVPTFNSLNKEGEGGEHIICISVIHKTHSYNTQSALWHLYEEWLCCHSFLWHPLSHCSQQMPQPWLLYDDSNLLQLLSQLHTSNNSCEISDAGQYMHSTELIIIVTVGKTNLFEPWEKKGNLFISIPIIAISLSLITAYWELWYSCVNITI